MAITKLDVLDSFETIKICVAYRYQGKLLQEFPENLAILDKCEPEYIEMPGWQQDLSNVTSYEELPPMPRLISEKWKNWLGLNKLW